MILSWPTALPSKCECSFAWYICQKDVRHLSVNPKGSVLDEVEDETEQKLENVCHHGCDMWLLDARMLLLWLLMLVLQLVAWHCGRTSVFGRRTFPVLCSTGSWRVTIMWVNQTVRYRSTNQVNSAFQPPGVDRWVVSCNWMSTTWVKGGAIWWTLTEERQAWCNL